MFSFVLSFAEENYSLHLGVWMTLSTLLHYMCIIYYVHSCSEYLKIDSYYHYNSFL